MILPKISLVTPSLNQASFIEATISSILSQEYPNIEYIIIDGGSTDGSQKVIQKYEDQLAYWCSEKDGGQYDAINKGFSKATGEIMGWLNADDMQCPWCLKTVGSIMSENPKVHWLSTLNRLAWDFSGIPIRVDPTSGFSRDAFLAGCYLPAGQGSSKSVIQQESTFWTRNLWERAGAGW